MTKKTKIILVIVAAIVFIFLLCGGITFVGLIIYGPQYLLRREENAVLDLVQKKEKLEEVQNGLLEKYSNSGDPNQLKTPEELQFVSLLASVDATFTHPATFEDTPVIENYQVGYDYAIKNTEKRLEIRYSVWPLQSMLKEYEASLADPNREMIDPNILYYNQIIVTILNANDLKMMTELGGDEDGMNEVANLVQDLNETSLLKFGADGGRYAIFEVGETFGQDYKYCATLVLHKNDVADIYVFFLADEKESLENILKGGSITADPLMSDLFYSVVFKQD